MSISLVLLEVPEEDAAEGDAGVIASVALSTNPVIEAKGAAVPCWIISILLTFVVGCAHGARGLVFGVLNGFRVGCCGTGSGRFGF
jgi:hypothetical protein